MPLGERRKPPLSAQRGLDAAPLASPADVAAAGYAGDTAPVGLAGDTVADATACFAAVAGEAATGAVELSKYPFGEVSISEGLVV